MQGKKMKNMRNIFYLLFIFSSLKGSLLEDNLNSLKEKLSSLHTYLTGERTTISSSGQHNIIILAYDNLIEFAQELVASKFRPTPNINFSFNYDALPLENSKSRFVAPTIAQEKTNENKNLWYAISKYTSFDEAYQALEQQLAGNQTGDFYDIREIRWLRKIKPGEKTPDERLVSFGMLPHNDWVEKLPDPAGTTLSIEKIDQLINFAQSHNADIIFWLSYWPRTLPEEALNKLLQDDTLYNNTKKYIQMLPSQISKGFFENAVLSGKQAIEELQSAMRKRKM